MFVGTLPLNVRTIHGLATLFLSHRLILTATLSAWCGIVLVLTATNNDIALICLLLVVSIGCVLIAQPATDAFLFLFTVALAKNMRLAMIPRQRLLPSGLASFYDLLPIKFLAGLVGLLGFASWINLDAWRGSYSGPRWMGLWSNPNVYGVLMGAGFTLAVGIFAGWRCKIADRSKVPNKEMGQESGSISKELDGGIQRATSGNEKVKLFVCDKIGYYQAAFLLVAAGMMVFGLLMSYSRGAWLATAIGLLFLARCYDKLKWRYVIPCLALVAVFVLLFWGRTPDSAPWYLKRADLGRASAQHRASAWRAGLEMMRDHPFGVGWNNAVKTYHYPLPEGGAGAMMTNDYMIIGTQLGVPALLCFLVYVGLCYRRSPRIQRSEVTNRRSQLPLSSLQSPPEGDKEKARGVMSVQLWREQEAFRATCLAAALVFAVTFWFDGGLFKLPTAAMFWVLLELGAYRPQGREGRICDKAVDAG